MFLLSSITLTEIRDHMVSACSVSIYIRCSKVDNTPLGWLNFWDRTGTGSLGKRREEDIGHERPVTRNTTGCL